MRRSKKFKVITSLHDNEKRQFENNNNDSDESDRDDRRRRKSNEGEETNVQGTYNCDICHSDDPTLPTIGPKEIILLDEDEQQILKFKKDLEVKILCLKHHQNEIKNWRIKRHSCCNVLGKHKKARKTDLKKITVKLAKEVHTYLGKKIIPFDSICTSCLPDLQLEIDRAKDVTNNPPDIPVPENFEEDILFETGSTEDLNENDLKDLILRNICEENEVDQFTKEQKVGIIRVLPSSWSTREVSDKTGKMIKKKLI